MAEDDLDDRQVKRTELDNLISNADRMIATRGRLEDGLRAYGLTILDSKIALKTEDSLVYLARKRGDDNEADRRSRHGEFMYHVGSSGVTHGRLEVACHE